MATIFLKMEVGDDFVVAAAIENRAKEVGIAVFARNDMHLMLTQIIETSRSASSIKLCIQGVFG